MALTTKTLAELARLNSGIGPVFSAQNPTTATDIASPVATANFGSVVATDLVDGDGVDVSNATYCVIRVIPTGGDVVFDVVSRSTSVTDEFEALNNLIGITASGPWKEYVFCGPEDEVVVIPISGSATSVEIEIGPCLGG